MAETILVEYIFNLSFTPVHVYLCMAPILAQASMEAARRGEAGM